MQRHPQSDCAGTALVWALLFVVLTSVTIVSHTTFMAANRRESDVRQRERALSKTFARSGLTDALAWFQRQAQQPVTAFDPQYLPSGNPPAFDTEDPLTGLVRSFQIRGNLWGRYEVRRTEVVDISTARGQTQTGTVWEMRARGAVFWRHDPGRPFDASPNRVIATETARTEVRGIPATPPADAALMVDGVGSLTVLSNVSVDGNGGAGMAIPDTGTLIAAPIGVAGSPALAQVTGYDAAPLKVFGMPLDTVSDYATLAIEGKYVPDDDADGYHDAFSRLPDRLPEDGLVFVRGKTSVPSGTALRGTGMLVFDGDVRFDADNDTRYAGMIYVNGDAVILGSFLLRGSLIVRGNATLGGSVNTVSFLRDNTAVERVRKHLQRYRISRNIDN